MRIFDELPFGLAIMAGTFWFAAGVCAGVERPTSPLIYRLLAFVLVLIGGVLGGILAERAHQAKRQTDDNWGNFECANCGDVHSPMQICYCGCKHWRKGERISQ